MTYLKNRFNKATRTPDAGTPQRQPIPGTVMNSAEGYSFPVDDWARLDRFLVLGSEGGSYYASEHRLTAENAEAVARCIQDDGRRVVRRIVEISEAGRAPKNDPALLALAMVFAQGDPTARKAAAEALPRVCRIGTHLFHFAHFVDALRGWGRGLRRAVADWYTQRDAKDVAFQAVKYQQRDGWAHRDLLRLAHPVPPTEAHQTVYHWIAKGWPEVGAAPHPEQAAQIIWAFERAKTAALPELLRLISDYRLPREAIIADRLPREALPTHALTQPAVWEAMLPHLGLTALIRNLGNLSKCGLLAAQNPSVVHSVVDAITSTQELRKAKVHPIQVLSALITYQRGQGARGSGVWEPVASVVDALDKAFYAAFGNVTSSGKRIQLALDVSGSMSMGTVAGVPGLTPRIASAAMALVTAATEQNYLITAFSTELVPVDISPRQRLDDVVRRLGAIPMGGTDCALPMRWSLTNKHQADAFAIYTDSETWFGKVHPMQALRQYRAAMGIPARLVVVGMVANRFSIADPADGGALDVVGFDTAAPELISDFVRG